MGSSNPFPSVKGMMAVIDIKQIGDEFFQHGFHPNHLTEKQYGFKR